LSITDVEGTGENNDEDDDDANDEVVATVKAEVIWDDVVDARDVNVVGAIEATS
jgi:hypothetical protein